MSKLLKNIIYGLAGLIIFFCLIALHMYIITEGDYLVYETADHDLSIPSLEIQGTTIHAETFGPDSAEMVMVLHDGPGKDFRQLLPLKQLDQNYQVVFYDQRGGGLSIREDESTLNMEQMIIDLHAIIQYYSNSSTVNIIGYSWGGILATAYVAKYPQDLNKLIIIEPWDYSSLASEENNFKRFQYSTKCWFKSRHVKGPDQHASTDYYFSQLEQTDHPHKGGLHYLESNEAVNQDYWRYGALANKMILRSLMDEEGQVRLDYFSGVEHYTNEILIISAGNKERKGLQLELLSACEEQTQVKKVQCISPIEADEIIKIIQEFLNNDTLK